MTSRAINVSSKAVAAVVIVLLARRIAYAIAPTSAARLLEHLAVPRCRAPRPSRWRLAARSQSRSAGWPLSVCTKRALLKHRLLARTARLGSVFCARLGSPLCSRRSRRSQVCLLETYLHWRAGLGWHGIQECVFGPVTAISCRSRPRSRASLRRCSSRESDVVAWMRRTFSLLRGLPLRVLRSRRLQALAHVTAPRTPWRRRYLRGLGRGLLSPVNMLLKPKGETSIQGAREETALCRTASLPQPVGLVLAGSAFAHAELNTARRLAEKGQVFTLAVPTEKENATTTEIELTPPAGFAIDSFAPVAGLEAPGPVNRPARRPSSRR